MTLPRFSMPYWTRSVEEGSLEDSRKDLIAWTSTGFVIYIPVTSQQVHTALRQEVKTPIDNSFIDFTNGDFVITSHVSIYINEVATSAEATGQEIVHREGQNIQIKVAGRIGLMVKAHEERSLQTLDTEGIGRDKS